MGGGRLGSNYSYELSRQFLDVFYEYGGTTIDTARSYSPWQNNGRGKSEECIGKWIEEKGIRDNIVLVTKGGIKENGSIDNSKNNLLKELEESLEALRTDYIDIYLLHKDDFDDPIEEIVETMQALKEKAAIRKIGVSNMCFNRIYNAADYAARNHMEAFSVIQTWWSLGEYKDNMWNDKSTTHMEDALYQFLLTNNLICMAYTSQCKGYFQKKVLGECIPSFLQERIETERNIKKAEYIKEFCKKYEVHPTAFVNGYITSNPLHGIAILSSSSVDQLQNIMDNCDFNLPDYVIKEIDNI